MQKLPSVKTPLNQHSLFALETWLCEIGAIKNDENPCLWRLETPHWQAHIIMESDELKVTWDHNGMNRQCCFPYGLSREDVQNAIFEGP